MTKVHVLVEGQTEETFIREVLEPHLSARGIYPNAKLATTKRVKSGPDFKGGIVSYGKFKNDVLRLLGDTSAQLVTTMVDFYGLPADFPGRKTQPLASCYDRVTYLENEIRKDIAHPRFRPYLALHEFEAMLFAEPTEIAQAFPESDRANDLTEIRAQFNSPEEIDDGPETAPSRRLSALLPQYEKPLHGSLIVLEIGVERIREECAHFAEWIACLEKLGHPGQN